MRDYLHFAVKQKFRESCSSSLSPETQTSGLHTSDSHKVSIVEANSQQTDHGASFKNVSEAFTLTELISKPTESGTEEQQKIALLSTNLNPNGMNMY